MADYDQLYPFEKGIAEVRKGAVSKEHIRRSFPISIGIGWGHWFYPRCYHQSHFGWGIGFPLWWPDYGYEEIIPAVEVKRGYIDNTGKVIAATSNDHVFPATENGILITTIPATAGLTVREHTPPTRFTVRSSLLKTQKSSLPKMKTRSGACFP